MILREKGTVEHLVVLFDPAESLGSADVPQVNVAINYGDRDPILPQQFPSRLSRIRAPSEQNETAQTSSRQQHCGECKLFVHEMIG